LSVPIPIGHHFHAISSMSSSVKNVSST
jgi:hypothetical protein